MTQSAGLVGADSAQLRKLASELNTAATKLAHTQRRLNVLIGRTKWNGLDRGAFLMTWTRELGPAMTAAGEALRETGRVLCANALDQEQTSSSARRFLDHDGIAHHCAEIPRGPSLTGDQSGTFDWEPLGSWDAMSGTDQEAGRDLLAQALRDTGDPTKIAPDEFEIVALDNGKYMVVLPGVTDLSKWSEYAIETFDKLRSGELPGDSPLGLDPFHRSVRDLDFGALGSASGPHFESNPYAQYVNLAIKAYGVPAGSEITIVGHSYGADTAVDLAAFPPFNGGPGGYTVTHVLAAGYHSEPDLASIPGQTQVLAIQNNHDLVAGVERAGHGSVQVISGMNEVVRGTQNRDFGRAVDGLDTAGDGTAKTVTDIAKAPGDFAWDVVSGARPTNPAGGVDDAFGNLVTLEPRTSITKNGQVNIVFEGGDVGYGHDPRNYVEYVTTTDSAEVIAFQQSLAASGYTGSGVATAHDVSVRE